MPERHLAERMRTGSSRTLPLAKRLRFRGLLFGYLKKDLQIAYGAYRDRTDDLRLAKPALSQLS